MKAIIKKEDQVLLTNSMFEESILREYKPGIFFTNNSELINFNTSPPTYRNITLKKDKRPITSDLLPMVLGNAVYVQLFFRFLINFSSTIKIYILF